MSELTAKITLLPIFLPEVALKNPLLAVFVRTLPLVWVPATATFKKSILPSVKLLFSRAA